MQNANIIARQPILIALLLSAAVHAVMLLHSHGVYAPPMPKLESGRTVVQLTLLPSLPTLQQAPTSPPATTAPVEKEIQPIPKPAPVKAKETPTKVAAPSSREQDASREKEKGVTSEAAVVGEFRPSYPRIARNRGEEGTITLSIRVLSDGTAGEVSILQSSGIRRLDEAALKGAKKTTYKPALRFGRAVDSTMKLSYTFRLTDD